MDENKRNEDALISEPDESGVRYYHSTNARSTQGVQIKTKQKTANSSLRNSLIILGCIIAGIVLLGVSCDRFFYGGRAEVKFPPRPYIATVYVEGTILESSADAWGSVSSYHHEWTLDKIDQLIYDGNNMGLIVFVDSPGGGIYESDELYFKIKEYQNKTGNPVYSALGSMAASGGYYISAPADKIVANRNCWTGSIGVTIGTLVDFSEFLDRYGIKTTTITSGANKAMGSSFEPVTNEQRAIFQSLVDEAYNQFVDVIAEGRDMEVDRVKELADGRIYSAKQAFELGLIDQIGTLDEAISDMKTTYELEGCEVVDIYYVNYSILASLLGNTNLKNLGGRGDAAVLMDLLDKQNPFPVSYLCELMQ